MDTGASDDLIGTRAAKEFGLETVESENPKCFATAGGQIKVTHRSKVKVQGIEKEIWPWVTESSPELLSVGKRIKDGLSFAWIENEKPFFIDRKGNIIRLKYMKTYHIY